ASPFDESAILSIDGFGDFTSTMIGIGNNTEIRVLDSVIYPHSLGVFYTAFTQYLGFENYGDEYKVMGLSPYGKATMIDEIKDVLIFKNNGLFEINKKYFTHPKEGVNMNWESGSPFVENIFSTYMEDVFGKARVRGDKLTQKHKDLAASVQRVTEELIFHILNHLQKRTGLKRVCIAGGVAQNSVANGKILNNTSFDDVYIPPAGHDAGTAMGSALWYFNNILGNDRIEPMKHSFWGSSYSDDEVESYLTNKGVKYKKYSDVDLFDVVTDCLINAGVVGWFQGKAEFGPRALGHRSILCDPTRSDAKDLINAKIKRREPFRPFAPSILQEYVEEYFIVAEKAPFMEKVLQFKNEKMSDLSAVVHIDGSGRLHTVDNKIDERYYNLINAFYKKTGVPILLNTSFNENEPIVNTPDEAYACFCRTKMDMVVMGNIIVLDRLS
ncbi:MAG: carbamoyltransferase, partial [Planctomycetes bacterium]|nr:carbamoyltransferase [Planctomycetota bacterium]